MFGHPLPFLPTADQRELKNNPCPDDVLIERHIKDSDCDCSTSGEECGNDNGDEKGVSYHFEKPDDRYRKLVFYSIVLLYATVYAIHPFELTIVPSTNFTIGPFTHLPSDRFGRTALLAQAERDRLAAEQKEIEAEDERKQAVAEFMKKRYSHFLTQKYSLN